MGRQKANTNQTSLLDVEPKKIGAATIQIPQLSKSSKIGKNYVHQVIAPEQKIEAEIYEYAKSVVLLRSKEGHVYYVKLSGARTKIDNKEILKATGVTSADQLNEASQLKWLNSAQEQIEEPDEITEQWRDTFSFNQESADGKHPGLRKPQIGAIHAISAYWTVEHGTATVVMPTGTGKTETMLSTLIYHRCKRLIVIVPSKTLRRQISEKFLTLGHLRKLNVVDKKAPNPKVAIIKHGVGTKLEAKALTTASNVIVTTASALTACDDEARAELIDQCSHMFIDEAHHVPAKSWNDIKEMFAGKPVIQFTATPFRRDMRLVEGEIIYNYPLGMAQEDDYFKKIDLIKLQEFDDTKADEAIAKAALGALEKDLGQNPSLDHILMARCRSKTRAQELIKLYQDHGAKYNPMLITSDLTDGQYLEAESKLKARECRVVVCVDMLGEGFDLPNLKIAAIHDTHKSLAVTLQFIGRFTRSSENVGDASVIVNVNDPKVNKDLESLYSDNPDWNELLKEKSHSAIKNEIKIHEFLQEFKGELSKHVSLWNLRPSRSALIFETKCDNWQPEKFVEAMPERYLYWHAVNDKDKFLVFVISKEDDVNWGKYKDIKNHGFELCVAHWDENRKALFLHCSNYKAFNATGIAKAICGSDVKIKNGDKVFNIFSGVERTLATNVGVSTVGNNISYTMHFGNDVTQGLSKLDKSQGVLNNVAAQGYEDGNIFTGGCSEKTGKIFSRGGGTIPSWRDWCYRLADKIFDNTIRKNKIVEDFLRPTRLAKRYPAIPLSIQWGEKILKAPEENIGVIIGDTEYKVYETDLSIVNNTKTGPITFKIRSDTKEAIYKITYSKNGSSYQLDSGNAVKIRRNTGEPISFLDYITLDPMVVMYIDGSFSYNDYHVPTPKLNTFFDKDRLKTLDWSGVNIKRESMGKDLKKDTVQFKSLEILDDEYEVVFNDDDSGEAADLIGIRQENSDTIKLHLVHCKFSKEKTSGSRVDDFYALLGQAQKSIRWKHSGLDYLAEHMKQRNAGWIKENKTRFIKGSAKELNRLQKLSRFAPNFVFEVTIVQPGLSKSSISDDVIQLLGSTEDYLVKTSNAVFSVYCSA